MNGFGLNGLALNLDKSEALWLFPLATLLCSSKSVIPVETQFLLRKTFEYTKQSNTYILLYGNSQRVAPFFIKSSGGAPSLLFQRVGPLLYYLNRWSPFFIISTGGLLYYFNGWVPSLLFQRVGPFFIISTGGPLLYYFKGAWGPFFIISTGGSLLY